MKEDMLTIALHICSFSVLHGDVGQSIVRHGAAVVWRVFTVRSPHHICHAAGHGGHGGRAGQVPQPGHEEVWLHRCRSYQLCFLHHQCYLGRWAVVGSLTGYICQLVNQIWDWLLLLISVAGELWLVIEYTSAHNSVQGKHIVLQNLNFHI